MNAASTLCAAGTIGAAALGYAFGHPAVDTSTTLTQSSSNRDDVQHANIEAAANLRYNNPPQSAASRSRTDQHNQNTPGSSARLSTPPTLRQGSRPASYTSSDRFGLGLTSRPTSTGNTEAVSVTGPSPVLYPRRSNSPLLERKAPIKRISTLRLSWPSRPSTGDTRISKSTYSDFSTTQPPIQPKERTEAPLRNRLVKRSLSVSRILDSSTGIIEPDIVTLKRPATSRQRSETLQSSLAFSGAEFSPLERPKTSALTESKSEQLALPLTPRLRRSRKAMFGLDQQRERFPVRRLVRQSRHTPSGGPTLLLVKNIHPTTHQIVCSVDEELHNPYFTKTSATVQVLEHSPASSPEKQTRRPARPQRSLSIGDLLSREAHPVKVNSRRKTTSNNGHDWNGLSSSKTASAPYQVMPNEEHSAKRSRRRTSQDQSSSPLRAHTAGVAREPTVTNAADMDLLSPHQSDTDGSNSKLAHHSAAPADMSDYQRVFSQSSDASGSSIKAKWTGKPARNSVTPSEMTSESGTHVFDDDGELRSDAHFDSIRTALTGSSAGRQGPRLDTLFDKMELSTLASKYSASPNSPKRPSHISEENESMATPVQGDRPNEQESPLPRRAMHLIDQHGSPSLRPSPQPLSLGKLAWDADDEENEEMQDWSIHDHPHLEASLFDEVTTHDKSPLKRGSRKATFVSPDMSPNLGPEQEKKNTLFDWSEQSLERTSFADTPPRPKTVHGKKDAEGRGQTGRNNGRRSQSGLHTRSHSVPVLPDLGSRPRTDIMNKFGTWGIGSKGVTEDWDDDFDFEDEDAGLSGVESVQKSSVDERPSRSVVVPKLIQEQQSSVKANIDLLREWGLLIEQLKILKPRVMTQGIDEYEVAELFGEIDAMIDLADQEAEDESLPSHTSLHSTPNMDRDSRQRGLRNGSQSIDETLNWPEQQEDKADEHQDHTDEDEQLEFRVSGRRSLSASVKSSPMSGHRARKNSEAIAKSVILAMRRKASPQDEDSGGDRLKTPVQKVPFDTATLRHIVPYVNVLVRRAKQLLRDIEGLDSAPRTPEMVREPALARAFYPADDSPTSKRDRRLRSSLGDNPF